MNALRSLFYNSIISSSCNHNWKVSKAFCGKKFRIFGYQCAKKNSNYTPLSFENEFDEGLESRYKINYDVITCGNDGKKRKLKLLLTELERAFQQGTQLPEVLNVEDWRKLLTLFREEQNAFLQHRLFVENLKKTKEKTKIKYESYFNEEVCAKGLFCETICESIPRLYNFKLLQSIMDGQKIIVDCGFEKIIPKENIWPIAKDMFLAWTKNRSSPIPSHIIYCNLNPNGELFSSFMELFPETEDDPSFPLSWTEKSYLDFFPKKELLYLTPNTFRVMKQFDGSKIYIIGGLLPTIEENLSYEKARRDEIPPIKLPIEEYFGWKGEAKALSVDECVALLNDLKEGCDWNVALRHVPKEKRGQQKFFSKRKYQANSIRKKYRDDFMETYKR